MKIHSGLIAALFTGIFALPAYGASNQSANSNNLWFILDASGSMWGQVEGTAKIDIAKRTLVRLMGDIDPATNVAVIAYGHTRKDDCGDIQAITGLVNKANRGRIGEAIKAIKPKGKTPMADSLLLTGTMITKNYKSDRNTIVLISDGIETCGGDACAAAGKLAGDDIGIITNVVGFDISAKDRAQLECIAEKGKGKYFPANSTAGFSDAVRGAVKLAQAQTSPPPPPPAPTYREIFSDDFNGDELGESWKVLNPDPEAFIVENGVLTLLTQDVGNRTLAQYPNVLQLMMPVPKGDWRITFKAKIIPQTFAEAFGVGVGNDDLSKVVGAVLAANTGNYVTTGLDISGFKTGKGMASFTRRLFSVGDRDFGKRREKFAANFKSVMVRLEKKGRKYIASAKLEPASPGEKSVPRGWVMVQELTSLRAPGKNFYLWFRSKADGNYTAKTGESTIDIDWVKVEAPGKAQ